MRVVHAGVWWSESILRATWWMTDVMYPGDIHANVPVQPPFVTCDAPLYTAYRVLFFCFDLRPKVYKLEVHNLNDANTLVAIIDDRQFWKFGNGREISELSVVERSPNLHSDVHIQARRRTNAVGSQTRRSPPVGVCVTSKLLVLFCVRVQTTLMKK